MKILSVGTMNGISNTCLHRNWALEKIADHIDIVNTTLKPISLWYRIANRLFLYGVPVRLPDSSNANRKIKELVSKNVYDVVWIDKGTTISGNTLRYIKKQLPKAKIVSYSPDNMALRHNQSQNYLESIPLYDYIFTNKSYILDDMKKLGAKNVEFVNNSYEARFHYPRQLTPEEVRDLGGDVGFVGVYEKERCDSILFLVENGIKVTVYGDGKWNNYKEYNKNLTIKPSVFSEDYSKVLQAFKISLCFLRKINFDQQTTRTVEIPACGGFMLAERTKEHLDMFEDGKEAAFFSSNEELLEKCRYYLENEEEREKVRDAGTNRCKISEYSNEGAIKKMINKVI